MSLALAGCLPSFDRCRIPGTAGCPEADAGVLVDAGGGGCTALPSGVLLASTGFAEGELDRFTLVGDPGATWSTADMEMLQSTPTQRGSSALLGEVTNPDVLVVARMRRLSGTGSGAMELLVRGTASNSYHCNWEPNTGAFEIQRDDSPSALVENTIDLGSIEGYDPTMPVTMQLEVVGDRLSCCLREISGARLNAFDSSLTSGSPGLRTYRLGVAFSDLAVYAAD